MKVNSIDARKYDAKQLNVAVTPPSIAINYELLTGAKLPTEFKTEIPMGHLKLTMYFRGKDRNSINRNMSSFMANFTESCDLDLNGYKGIFRGYMTNDDYEDTVSKKRKKLNLEFDGFFYDDEIVNVFDGVASVALRRGSVRKERADKLRDHRIRERRHRDRKTGSRKDDHH